MEFQRANELIVKILQEWVNLVGKEASGAKSFYSRRLERGQLLVNYDRAVLEYANSNFDKAHRLIDVGCGFGSLSALLALNGFQVVGIEQMDERLHGARHLQAELAKMEPETSARLQFSQQDFPFGKSTYFNEKERKVLILTNLVAARVRKTEDAFISAISRFDELLIDVAKFGFQRDEKQRRALLSKLKEYGFLQKKSFFVSTDSEMYHFEIPSAAHRRFLQLKRRLISQLSSLKRKSFRARKRYLPTFL